MKSFTVRASPIQVQCNVHTRKRPGWRLCRQEKLPGSRQLETMQKSSNAQWRHNWRPEKSAKDMEKCVVFATAHETQREGSQQFEKVQNIPKW